MRGLCVVLMLMSASIALACSGPHVVETVVMANAYGKAGFLIQAMIAVATHAFYRASKFGPGQSLIMLTMLVAHPHWWVSAGRGDCGGSIIQGTTILLFISTFLLIWQIGVGIHVWRRAVTGAR